MKYTGLLTSLTSVQWKKVKYLQQIGKTCFSNIYPFINFIFCHFHWFYNGYKLLSFSVLNLVILVAMVLECILCDVHYSKNSVFFTERLFVWWE